MGCGCGKSGKQVYVVTKGDGTTVEVSSRADAIQLAMSSGGTWKLK